jgi:aryl-alcohol dehydrogenase-like predicted oxidoreductase
MVRNPEVAVLETCAELNIGFAAFSPTARGLLADAVHDDNYVRGDIRSGLPRFVEPQLSHNLKAVRAFNALARDNGLTPAQLTIAWVLARADHIAALPGTRSIAHLEEDVSAANIDLDPALVEQVSGLFAGDAIRGTRYPQDLQDQVDTELLPGEALA